MNGVPQRFWQRDLACVLHSKPKAVPPPQQPPLDPFAPEHNLLAAPTGTAWQYIAHAHTGVVEPHEHILNPANMAHTHPTGQVNYWATNIGGTTAPVTWAAAPTQTAAFNELITHLQGQIAQITGVVLNPHPQNEDDVV